jgi:radical SAM protein
MADGETVTSGRGRDRFAASPLLVIWEVTRACDLACVHCRASAIPGREPHELTTDEGRRLIAEVRGFGRPVMVFTGGDPLKRPDIFELIEASAKQGLPTHLSPSGTPLLTHDALWRAQRRGLNGISISFDGSNSDIHDRFRRVQGSFGWSLEGAGAAVGLGLQLQVNTTVTRHNLQDLPAIATLVGSLEAHRWSIFLLVATGRAAADQQISAAETEEILGWLYRLSKEVRFRIKTTEAPHYRRITLQQQAAETGAAVATMIAGSAGGRFVPGMNDGSGFVFVNSRGDVHPSGFLPITAGNVRTDSLVDLYRAHPLFVALRDPDRLKGRCGRCEFRTVCGGSRARAFAASGDYLDEDPACAYIPAPGSIQDGGGAHP